MGEAFLTQLLAGCKQIGDASFLYGFFCRVTVGMSSSRPAICGLFYLFLTMGISLSKLKCCWEDSPSPHPFPKAKQRKKPNPLKFLAVVTYGLNIYIWIKKPTKVSQACFLLHIHTPLKYKKRESSSFARGKCSRCCWGKLCFSCLSHIFLFFFSQPPDHCEPVFVDSLSLH